MNFFIAWVNFLITVAVALIAATSTGTGLKVDLG